MMRILGYILVLLLTYSTAQAKKTYEIRWGINLAPIRYFQGAAEEFKAAVEKRTNGDVKVTLIFNQFDVHRSHNQDVLNGTYNMGQSPVMELAHFFPEFKVWDLPFLFEDDEHVARYIASTHGQANMNKIKKWGLTPVGYTYSGGFLEMYSEKEFNSFAQLKNQHVAFEGMGEYLMNDLFLNYKVKIHPLEHGDILEKEKTKSPVAYAEVIAASINDIFTELGRVPKYINKTDHRVITRVMYLYNPFLDSLPKKYRKIVLEEARKGRFVNESFQLRINI